MHKSITLIELNKLFTFNGVTIQGNKVTTQGNKASNRPSFTTLGFLDLEPNLIYEPVLAIIYLEVNL